MSSLRILTDRSFFYQGERVEGIVRLELDRPAVVQALELRMLGTELAPARGGPAGTGPSRRGS